MTETVIYRPQGALHRLFTERDRLPSCTLVEGPAGTGKSLALMMLAALRAEEVPGIRILIARKTRAALTNSTLVTLEEHVLKGHSALSGPGRQHRTEYSFPNGSAIAVAGLDEGGDNSTRIMSTEWDMVVVDEATELSEDAFFRLYSRLRGAADLPVPRQLFALCNPSYPSHWLLRFAQAGKASRIITSHRDNPLYWDEASQEWTDEGRRYRDVVLGALTGPQRRRLLDGEWCAATGAIFAQFDRARHVIAPPAFDDSVVVVVGVDSGFDHPAAAVWVAYSPVADRAVVVRSYARRHETSDLHAKRIAAWSKEYAGRLAAVVVDDAAPELKHHLIRAGLPAQGAHKGDVSQGIDVISRYLANRDDGLPGLLIARGCEVDPDPKRQPRAPENLIDEIERYQWDQRRDGQSKDMPLKRDDDRLDALRYAMLAISRGQGVPAAAPARIELVRDAEEMIARIYAPSHTGRLYGPRRHASRYYEGRTR